MSQSTYKRLGKLGSGAFATTFVVEEIGRNGARSDKKLVMKRAPCKHMRAANAALQEVKVLLSCTHRGIVGYHDFFLDADGDDNIVICLIMEHCDGGDLWEKIAAARRAQTALEPATVAGWALQLVAALRYLHTRSILHRDIKPENIFITDGGQVVKLGDFGLATAAEDLDGSAKTQVGTPDYMAPEVLQGRPYDAAADVFSLGATLYAMVCSSFPKMLAMFLGQGKALEWPAASEAMVDWRELIAAMLSVEESARPTLLQIGEIAAGLPASAALVGASATAKEEASRPEGVGSAVFAMGVAPVPEAAVAQDVPIPSRPSQPIASEIGRGSLVLLWEPPLPTDVVGHYRILGQVGGANGFDILMDSTGSSEPIVRLTQLEENAWYEFKVVAMNASGGSPASSASLPVQTLGPPRLPAASSSHLLPVQHAMRPRAATPPPQSSTEGAEGLHEDAELLARIAQCKREMLAWDAKFERQHGRPPNDDDRSGDSVYHGALSRYKKLKHAKKRSSQRTGLAITPLDASIQPLTPTPGAPGPYFDGGPYVDEAHLLLERGMHISATAGLLNDGPSSSCATPCASHPSSPRSGATAPLTHSTPSSPAKEGQPRSKKSARHAHDKHNGTSRAHRAAGAKGHGQRGSHGSSHGGGGSRSTADSSASAAGSTMMTIAIKASHPSPRPLAVDESFD